MTSRMPMRARWRRDLSRLALTLASCGALGALSAAASAQTAEIQPQVVYDVAFFAQFSPSTALQMVEQVPGFVLDGGAFGVRGFGQAAGNVVINGQRPSSKSDTITSVLGRIPASRVLRIEIFPGSAFGADLAGKPQVANVVLNDAGGLAGNIDAKLVREWHGAVLPTLSASAVYTRGVSSFNASFKLQNYANNSEGFDRLNSLPDGELVSLNDVYSRSREPWKVISFGWARDAGENDTAHIDAKISIDPWNIDQTSQALFPTGGGEDIFTQRHVWKTYELSGDVKQSLLGGAIKLNVLASRRNRTNDDSSVQLLDGDLLGGFAYELDDRLDERLARLSWTRLTASGWQVELGGEGAYNRLTSETRLFDIDSDDDRTPVELPIGDAVVSEYRGEAFANAGRNIASTLYLDLGLTYEFSSLEVTGDATDERSLGFLKPKVSLDWRPGAWHVRLSAKRTVAQLDFGDFVSSAEVNDDRVSAGNAELQPQRAWEFLLSADRPVLQDGRVSLDVGYDRVSQVQDRIPTEEGLDAPGNLGNGTRWLLRGNADLPLATLGLKGARLGVQGTYLDTSVRDPYTLRMRPFSGSLFGPVYAFIYSVSLRQDFEKFAWGVAAKGNTGTTSYRRTERDESRGASPSVSAFVEYRWDPRTTATFGVENVLNLPSHRWRDIYTPDRRTPDPYMREYQERNSHRLFFVQFARTFG